MTSPAAAPDVVAIGETMLSLVSVGGPLAEASELLVTCGGAESNTCVGLARLGLRPWWVSRLGRDPAGDRVETELRAAGVDLRAVTRDPERPTGLMLRDTSGAPARYYRNGSAASALTPDDLDGVPVEDARAVLVTGITAMIGAGPRAAAIAVLERARGLRVVDPNLRRGLPGSDRAAELVRPLVARCDLLLGSQAELETLAGVKGRREAAARCRGLGPREVVLKRGAAGAAALDADGWTDHHGEAGPDRDPVGAGDAFNAGYLAARLRGGAITEALALGARCGAAVAAAVGDTAGFPAPTELETRGGTT